MKLYKNLAALILVGCAVAASAETRLIEGRGAAKNAGGVIGRFAVRVSQTNRDPAVGRLEFAFTKGDAHVAIVTERPVFVGVVERHGRMYGPAKVTVKRGTTTHTWEGTVYFQAWDLRPPTGGDRRDRVRIRFIRDVWSSPEGDFFYEGEVGEGDVVVKKS